MLKKVGEEEGRGLEADYQTFRWIVNTTPEACGAGPGEGGSLTARARPVHRGVAVRLTSQVWGVNEDKGRSENKGRSLPKFIPQSISNVL